jgi:hypothetical protein
LYERYFNFSPNTLWLAAQKLVKTRLLPRFPKPAIAVAEGIPEPKLLQA